MFSLITSLVICVTPSVVNLQNGQILSKTGSDIDDKWKPWTPRYMYLIHTCTLALNVVYTQTSCSQYQINVSEMYSTLTLYDGMDYTDYTALAHIPLRPSNDYYTLSDVLSGGQSLDGSFINILAIVKHVRVDFASISM